MKQCRGKREAPLDQPDHQSVVVAGAWGILGGRPRRVALSSVPEGRMNAGGFGHSKRLGCRYDGDGSRWSGLATMTERGRVDERRSRGAGTGRGRRASALEGRGGAVREAEARADAARRRLVGRAVPG